MKKRSLRILFLGYSIAVLISYALPIGLKDTEWYGFYSYLDEHSAVPYVDVREGYPPLGFLIYMPLYYAFRDNIAAFSYGFRALNGAFLVATLLVLHFILRSMFEERRALKLTLYYAVLPSVVIANVYSNDVVALLPAALAVYMMLKKKAVLCGVLLGVATLGKGFPILLLIPALIAFKDAEDKLKLIGVTLTTIVFVSLPFMIVNPSTYVSTFTHVGTRGPWETVWALMDGYYSHGGLLHPYFDKFFYHFNLLKIYPASSCDHAIYEWKFGVMPDLLTACQIAAIIIVTFVHVKRKLDFVSLCGLLYIAYILFFKGYSTQFSVSTPFFALLSTMNNPLPFLLPLELSHILQMVSWGSEIIVSEAFRNWHLPLLVSAIVMRTVVFSWLILSALKGARINFKQETTCLISYFSRCLKLFKDKRLISVIFASILMVAISFGTLYNSMDNYGTLRSYDGFLSVTVSSWENITIDGFEKGDQVMLKLKTNTWVDAKIVPNDLVSPMERGIINPYNLKGSFNETMLFFIAESESYNLMLKMKTPAMPFRVTDGLNGDLEVNVTSEDSALLFELHDMGMDGKGSMFRIAYPFSARIDGEFSLCLKYRAIEGNVSNIFLDVFTDTDDWIYTFNTTEDFVLKSDSKDLHGYANLHGDSISLIAVLMLMEDGSSATIRLEEISLNSGGKTYNVEFYAMDSEEIHYEVFVERDWKPSILYVVTLIISVALGIATFYCLYRRIRNYRMTSLNNMR